MEYRRLTSINPLITQGNELSGEIKVLNKARQVKTCNKDFLDHIKFVNN
jgi:hypothetical protein